MKKKIFIAFFILKKLILLAFVFFHTSCNKPIPVQKPVQEQTHGYTQTSYNRGKLLLEEDNKSIEKAIKTTYKNHKFKKTKLEFWISKEVVEKERNKMGDKVTYTYQIQDLKGSVLYDFASIGVRTIYIEKQNEIRGIEYALKLMQEKQEAYLLLPSFMAYGGYGDGKKIPPDFPLAIKLKIIKITKQ